MSQQSWQYQGAGQPLQRASTERPTPAAGQVLVANRVIALNPVDWKLVASGHSAWQAGHIPGVDGAGEVVAAGDGVDQGWLGQRVAYHTDLTRSGSFAEFTPVDARALIRIPDELGFQEAAAFPCPGLTAWQAVEKFPELARRNILVCGGGSGVGRVAIQLLLARGAHIWTTAAPDHHTQLLQWGVSACVDYQDEQWREQLQTLVPGGRFDGAIDLVSPENAASLYEMLGYGSHLVAVLGRVAPLGDPFSRCVSLHEIALGAIHQQGSDGQFIELVRAGEQLLHEVEQKTLQLAPVHCFAFSELGRALALLQAGGRTQKYLIEVRG